MSHQYCREDFNDVPVLWHDDHHPPLLNQDASGLLSVRATTSKATSTKATSSTKSLARPSATIATSEPYVYNYQKISDSLSSIRTGSTAKPASVAARGSKPTAASLRQLARAAALKAQATPLLEFIEVVPSCPSGGD
ncbi:hypothetical protein FRC04_006274 [Tulasnella sp. 424]|nr:hypothetical protein FRC04_006274 [Tulasnella sp. 424]KAG8961008.1 hypothetical protein FRC05_006407 [Tulasnella sp. 425]